MAVKIGHASIAENNTINGAKGDQTGYEVYTRSWYNKPWLYVIRAKNPSVAEKIAKACEAGCANNNIGYGQSNRTTLYTEAKKVGFNLSAVKTKCNTDCSAFVSVCVNSAGISVSKDMWTGNELNVLYSTGCFTYFTSAEYVSKSTLLKRGDILLGKGHTAMVLSDGSSVSSNATKIVTSTGVADKYDKATAGRYVVTSTALNLRCSAGTDSKVLVAIPKGQVVFNYGYFTYENGRKWLYVQTNYKGTSYTGFCSTKYLSKI